MNDYKGVLKIISNFTTDKIQVSFRSKTLVIMFDVINMI